MSKLVIVAAAGAGYVLGARAGRERYEQIRDQAQRLWSDPPVRRDAAQTEHAPTPDDMPDHMPQHPADPVSA